jgi:hypothetical protein
MVPIIVLSYLIAGTAVVSALTTISEKVSRPKRKLVRAEVTPRFYDAFSRRDTDSE